MVGSEIEKYCTRFHELCKLCPAMVTPEYKKIEQFISGLPKQIQSTVTASDHSTIQPLIRLAHKLTDQAVAQGKLPKSGEHLKPQEPKRKWEPSNNRVFSPQQPTQHRPAPAKVFTATQPNNQDKGDIGATTPNATTAHTTITAHADEFGAPTVAGTDTWPKNADRTPTPTSTKTTH
ncbi:hypothetical protein E3N88_31838 [Mikania micrantha]|uniref:Retrotransposon gag domain-containing protein n=1 Tax=Mikania micrantha TaxID=192012 RepID=A0A5N6M6R3_9ASTR|nr:hypothetical protein E3N88_31838 [Mikania micrantha]